MKTFLRMTSLAALAAATALVAAPASAATASTGVTSGSNATATARIIKPLTLVSDRNLNFGTILLSNTSFTGAVVALSRANVITCPTAQVTCSGNTSTARYTVTGTQGQRVTITSPDVVMTNANDSTAKLTMTVDSPGTVLIANSGATGSSFLLGGAITLDSTTLDGVYTGDFAVTVDY